MLLLHITRRERSLFPIKGAPAVVELEVGSEPMSTILDLLQTFDHPDAPSDLPAQLLP